LSGGRVAAGIGPGSSAADHAAVGLAVEERWARFDEAAAVLRHLLGRGPAPLDAQFYPVPDRALSPGPVRDGGVPVWLASWGSPAGLRRVARHGDGWLASAYGTGPDGFVAARARLPAVPAG